MDTWATSSLTPLIVCGWESDPDLFARTFPMDLRPQGHDIIRTWLFATVLRSHLSEGVVPWRHAALSGWILDPDRKKMSKSKGNVVTPMGLLERFSADAVRYWAASGRPGTDTAFDEGQMKIGRRLATKLLNASKFVLSFPEPAAGAAVTEPLDRAVLDLLNDVVAQATAALEAFEYTTALEVAERFFWLFCDDYLELVKPRAYADSGDAMGWESARLALRTSLSTLLRLFAPFIPYVTEEAWSWWHTESVHAACWPTATDATDATDAADAAGPAELVTLATTAISAVRKAKSDVKQSMRAPVEKVRVFGPGEQLSRLELIEDDIRAAGHIVAIEFETTTEPLRFEVTLPE
jgi:valyl-tRNA synthetase